MKATIALLSISLMLIHGAPAEAPKKHLPPLVPVHSRHLVKPEVFEAWSKVAWCEHHGNWDFEGSYYDGGLGIMPYNWIKYGGLRYARLPHLATPYAQVLVATRIQAGHRIPDQNGYCESW